MYNETNGTIFEQDDSVVGDSSVDGSAGSVSLSPSSDSDLRAVSAAETETGSSLCGSDGVSSSGGSGSSSNNSSSAKGDATNYSPSAPGPISNALEMVANMVNKGKEGREDNKGKYSNKDESNRGGGGGSGGGGGILSTGKKRVAGAGVAAKSTGPAKKDGGGGGVGSGGGGGSPVLLREDGQPDWSVLTNRVGGLAQQTAAFELLCFIDNGETDTQVKKGVLGGV